MKKLSIICLTFVMTLTTSFGQSKTDDVKTIFNHFLKLKDKKNYDKMFDYYHEEFLKIVPKSELLKDLAKLNSNSNYEYFVKDSEIILVSKSVKKNGFKYALIKYGANTHIKFNDKTDIEIIEIIKQNVKNTYGEKYSYSESNKEIVFHKESKMMAVFNKNWKFFPYSEKLKPFITSIVPKEILAQVLSK
tara:strand:+ start:45146 stop:45715 length:570 start_codon:yes stop_codon:yes gene_type:complete